MIVAEIDHRKHQMIEREQNQYSIEVLSACLKNLFLLFYHLLFHFLLLFGRARAFLKL